MNEKIKEWKERWNNGDVKFVPELFEMVDNLQKEKEYWIEKYRLCEKLF